MSRVLEILDALGARDFCQRMAQEHIDEAQAQLATTGIGATARREFAEVAEFLLTREF